MSMLFLGFVCLALNMLLNVRAQEGFISIDCGANKGYKDNTTNIFYNTDANFIDTGENRNISLNFSSDIFQEQLKNVRSFPEGVKNCYTLQPEQGKDNNYLIRAAFWYGNYDAMNQYPEFKLYLGVEEWDTVKLHNLSDMVWKEIIYLPKTDDIYVCLVNTGSGIPFISVLELRALGISIYNKTQSGSLVFFHRLNFGSATDDKVRYGDDFLDRIWLPSSPSVWESIQAPYSSSSLSETEFKLPPKVMETAVKPLSGNYLNFSLGGIDSSEEFYMYFHFAEVEEVQDKIRQFTILLNDKTIFSAPIEPKYMVSETHATQYSLIGSQLNFSLAMTNQSTLPPIMNALEIYRLKVFLQSPTEQRDVDSMKTIKSVYQVIKSSWQGDPCLPRNFLWEGLICSDNGYDPPSIISLNISSSNLTGKMDLSFSNLTSLQYLDLSYNSLTGEVPNFLAEFPSLKTLNLSWNNFTGSVPLALLQKHNDRILSLSLDGNPYLCNTTSCPGANKKRKKTVAVPVVASIASFLVLLGSLTILWSSRRRRKQNIKPNEEDKTLESKCRHLSYSEVERITDNFQNEIGKGGSGIVYLGHLPDDGTEVAVKMLLPSSVDGFKLFQTEAQLLTRVHHRNLVSLFGYCDEGSSMVLVYEYMSKGNLKKYLADKEEAVLTWEKRIGVAIDAAEGIEYLHKGCKPTIIHRDIKTENILLNDKLEAKVADFGWSRSVPIEGQTHVSTRIVGTDGYCDPEYQQTSRLTEKSDVYSFGVVLLELISGQPAIIKNNERNIHISQWIHSLLEMGGIEGIVDPRLNGDFDTDSARMAVETAIGCLAHSSTERPTMSDVAAKLKECRNCLKTISNIG